MQYDFSFLNQIIGYIRFSVTILKNPSFKDPFKSRQFETGSVLINSEVAYFKPHKESLENKKTVEKCDSCAKGVVFIRNETGHLNSTLKEH